MIEQWVYPTYQKILIAPIIKKVISKTRCTPSALTLLAALCGVFIYVALLLKAVVVACAFLILSGYLDSLDGSLARHLEKSTPMGAVLDIVADRFVEFMIIFGLYCFSPDTRGVYSLLMLGSTLICVTSFLVVGVFTKNESHKSFHYSPGLMERPEAFMFFLLMMLIPSWYPVLAILYTVLVLLTAGIRVYQFSS